MDEKSFVVPPDPRIGTVVRERYRIVRLLGEGGMGAVYEGEHLLIRRRCAIKFLHAQHARTPAAMTRFRREALAATSVGNPHVVEVTDMDQAEDGSPFLVLEYLEGRSLTDEVETYGPLPLARAFHIMRQLCSALAEVHEKGITHRDLKPDNLFLVRHGDDRDFVKILDFGISKFSTSDDGSTVNLTNTGTAVGSVYFMSPEQARGRSDVDPRADIYALGGVFFYLLTGRAVFEGDSLTYLLMQIVSDPPPKLSFLRPDVTPELEACVLRMLAKERTDRYPDCNALWQALAPHAEAARTAPAIAPRVNTQVLTPHAQGDTPEPSVLKASDPQAAARLPASTLLTSLRSAGRTLPWLLLAAGALAVWLVRGEPAREVAREPKPERPQVRAESVKIALQVRATPDDAMLYLDGERLGANPALVHLDRSDKKARISAMREGYEPAVREFTLDQDRKVTLELVPALSAAKPQPEPASTSSKSKVARVRTAERPSESAPAPAASAASVEPQAPEIKELTVAPEPAAPEPEEHPAARAKDIKRPRF